MSIAEYIVLDRSLRRVFGVEGVGQVPEGALAIPTHLCPPCQQARFLHELGRLADEDEEGDGDCGVVALVETREKTTGLQLPSLRYGEVRRMEIAVALGPEILPARFLAEILETALGWDGWNAVLTTAFSDLRAWAAIIDSIQHRR